MNACIMKTPGFRAAIAAAIGFTFSAAAISQEAKKPEVVDAGARALTDTAQWKIHDAVRATEEVRKLIGAAISPDVRAEASVAVASDDNTPFLSQRIVGKPAWRVELRDWKLQLPEVHADAPHSYNPNWEILLDPNSGQLLRIVSGHPIGDPPIPPEADAKSATEQLETTGNERYHGFPEEPPRISFVDAIRVLILEGENPLAARQIKAQYVEWSELGREHHSVWAITLRGIRFAMAERRGGPREAIYSIRHIVDAKTGKWLGATNSPAPTSEK